MLTTTRANFLLLRISFLNLSAGNKAPRRPLSLNDFCGMNQSFGVLWWSADLYAFLFLKLSKLQITILETNIYVHYDHKISKFFTGAQKGWWYNIISYGTTAHSSSTAVVSFCWCSMVIYHTARLHTAAALTVVSCCWQVEATQQALSLLFTYINMMKSQYTAGRIILYCSTGNNTRPSCIRQPSRNTKESNEKACIVCMCVQASVSVSTGTTTSRGI